MKKVFSLLMAAIFVIALFSGCGGSDTPKVVWEPSAYDDEDSVSACANAHKAHVEALLSTGADNITEVTSTGLITALDYVIVDDWDKKGTLEFWDGSGFGVIKYDNLKNTVTLSCDIINVGMCDDFAREITSRLDKDGKFYEELAADIETARTAATDDFYTRYDRTTGEKIA